MSLFSTPSPPSEAGGTGPAGGRPDFPSPTKLERNGLTGTELGAQKKYHCRLSTRILTAQYHPTDTFPALY